MAVGPGCWKSSSRKPRFPEQFSDRNPHHVNLEQQKQIMTIELYVFPPSPRAFKAMVVANHLGIDTTLHIIDLINGDQKTPEYAALNPNMRMPTLKDGEYVLWESNAIGQYLAIQKPLSGLAFSRPLISPFLSAIISRFLPSALKIGRYRGIADIGKVPALHMSFRCTFLPVTR